jgi:hypothetical protein
MQKTTIYGISILANGYNLNKINITVCNKGWSKYNIRYLGAFANQKNQQTYLAFVNKCFTKPENIIKLMQLPDK